MVYGWPQCLFSLHTTQRIFLWDVLAVCKDEWHVSTSLHYSNDKIKKKNQAQTSVTCHLDQESAQ